MWGEGPGAQGFGITVFSFIAEGRRHLGVAIADMDGDWRLTGANEIAFRGAVFVRKTYTQWSPEWDHDHCSFCWADFVQAGAPGDNAGALHEGYSTPGPPSEPRADYYWVCPSCFDDFRERLEWTVRPSGNDAPS